MSESSPSSAQPGIIEVKLREVGQLFNSLDPTPFPERDLDADAEEFIVSWAMEYHKRTPLKLRIHVTTPPDARHSADKVADGVHHYFGHKAGLTQRKLRHLLSRGRWSLLIGMIFLAFCLGAADRIVAIMGEAPIFQIIRESLVIGGWVAMWRPMEIFLYDWWPLRYERQVYESLSRAKVEMIVPA